MELSADNIEELARAMSDNSGAAESANGVVYQNKANLDVDQVISEAQDCLLNSSIEPTRSYSTSCSFNDIFDDICEMNKSLELEQAAANSLNSQTHLPQITDLSNSGPAFFHMPDITLNGDYTPDCSFSNQTDFLQPLGQWPDYLPMPPSALSSIQEIPHLTPIPTVSQQQPPTPPPPSTSAQSSPIPAEVSIELPSICLDLNLDEAQVASNTPAPVQLVNNFHFNFSAPVAQAQYVQQCDNTNVATQFPPMEKNINFVMLKDPSAGPPKKNNQQQRAYFDWARVVPRKGLVQPSEVMILRPFRTRKVISSRPCLDLASYFDTSSITIPMIRERPRCKNTNRRKQKLRTIPGADNLKFEVQLLPVEVNDGHSFTDQNNNADQLYPETEIPELDEIFKRKRRGFTSRRLTQRTDTPTSSYSVEDDPEVAAGGSPDQPTERSQSNESDMDSDDAPLTVVKSMKCQNCSKLFKTCRSLTIHYKRCNPVRRTSEKVKPVDIAQAETTRRRSHQSSNSKENTDGRNGALKPTVGVEVGKRPLTRSQTNAAKRKAAVSDGCVLKKRFK